MNDLNSSEHTVAPGEPSTERDSDETALLARLREGEDAAFETLVRSHSTRLFSVARRVVGTDEDARDVVQDAFLSAFRAVGSFHGDARLSTWLHRIVVNTALMKLRSRRRRPEESIEPLLPGFQGDGHFTEQLQDWNEPVDQTLSRAETRALVRHRINELPESFRTVLLLRDIEGLSTEEAAKALETTANAVKIRLHRARQALRTLLAPHLGRGEL